MNCRQIQEKMLDYMMDELPYDDISDFEKHLSLCKNCETLYVETKSTFDLVAESESPERDEVFWSQFDSKLYEKINLKQNEKKIVPFPLKNILAYAASILIAVLSLIASGLYIDSHDTEMMAKLIYVNKRISPTSEKNGGVSVQTNYSDDEYSSSLVLTTSKTSESSSIMEDKYSEEAYKQLSDLVVDYQDYSIDDYDSDYLITGLLSGADGSMIDTIINSGYDFDTFPSFENKIIDLSDGYNYSRDIENKNQSFSINKGKG